MSMPLQPCVIASKMGELYNPPHTMTTGDRMRVRGDHRRAVRSGGKEVMMEPLFGRTPTGRRKALRACLIAFASLSASLGTPLARSAELHRFAAPASWVKPAEPRYEAIPPAGSADASAFIQLYDRQIDVGEAGDDYYRHAAVKVLNSAGVDDYSQINLVVDPVYQSIDIHRLRIVRNGKAIDQKPLARITELPQETEARDRIYNGRYNINIELSDVRAGDVVEYSYTIHSRERMFPGHFFARLDTGWEGPVLRQRIRVRAPVARELVFRSSDGSPIPAPTVVGDSRELTVEWHDLAPLPVLRSTPGWYPLWPYIEIGDRISWAEVARTAEPLFRLPAKLGPGVTKTLDAIRGAGGTPAAQALRALQYVQEEIRYTSFAMGRGSYGPAPPEVVLERRFGDCKDKSLLLATLLNRLGVEAKVALVESSRGRALDDSLPTPYAFDHAIVRAAIGGSVYWLDPTAETQYEPLTSSHHPDFERALPVSSGTAALEVIPPPAPDMRCKEVTTTLDLSAGLKAAGTLEITTRYKGAMADEQREGLADESAEQMRTDYETYAARYYPGARSIAPVDIQDDKVNDVLTVKEQYRLESTFTPDEKGVLEFTFHAEELYGYARALGAGARKAPLALEYPIRVRQRVIAKLPEDWGVEAGVVTVDNPAFRYRRTVEYSDRRLTLDYEYEALASYVAPGDIAKFEADRARTYADLGYVLSRKDPAGSGGQGLAVAPVPMLILVLVFAVALWAAIRWGYRYDPPPWEPAGGGPAGIGGWLLLPALSMILTPITAGIIAFSWLPYIEGDLWHKLPTLVNTTYAGSARLSLLSILALSAVLTVTCGLTAVLFFAKRTSAPRFFIAVIWLALLWSIGVSAWGAVTGLGANADLGSASSGIPRQVITALLWTAYMVNSRRVKATFVRRLRQPEPEPPLSAPEGANSEGRDAIA